MHKNFWVGAPDHAAIICGPVASLTIFLELLTDLLSESAVRACAGEEGLLPLRSQLYVHVLVRKAYCL